MAAPKCPVKDNNANYENLEKNRQKTKTSYIQNNKQKVNHLRKKC